MANKTWPPEVTEQLKPLVAEGYSARQIARILSHTYPCSREAVIGKVKRLGLKLARLPYNKKQATESPAAPAASNKSGRKIRQKSELPPTERYIPVEEPTPPTAISLLELTDHHCRQPFAGPIENGNPSTVFCGKQREKGSSYCAHHTQQNRQSISSRIPSEHKRAERGRPERKKQPNIITMSRW